MTREDDSPQATLRPPLPPVPRVRFLRLSEQRGDAGAEAEQTAKAARRGAG
jgi:hypothetical protein